MVSESIGLIHHQHAPTQVAADWGILALILVADTVAKHTAIVMIATKEIIFRHYLQERKESDSATRKHVSIQSLFGHFLEARSITSIHNVVSSLKLQGLLMDDLFRHVKSALQIRFLSFQRLSGRNWLNDEMIASAIFPESSCYNLSNCTSNWTPRFMTEWQHSCILVPYLFHQDALVKFILTLYFSCAFEKLCDWRNKCLFVNLKYRALANPSCGSLGQNTVTSLSLTHMAQVIAQLTAEWALLSGLGFGRSDLSKKLHCLHLFAQSSTWPRISHHWESRYTRFSGHISLGLQLRCTRTIHTLHQQGYC